MKLEDIKFGSHVVNALTIPRFFSDLGSRTSLDHKTLQKALDRLRKHGYITKNSRGEWSRK